jgi:hypothetical protein
LLVTMTLPRSYRSDKRLKSTSCIIRVKKATVPF